MEGHWLVLRSIIPEAKAIHPACPESVKQLHITPQKSMSLPRHPLEKGWKAQVGRGLFIKKLHPPVVSPPRWPQESGRFLGKAVSSPSPDLPPAMENHSPFHLSSTDTFQRNFLPIWTSQEVSRDHSLFAKEKLETQKGYENHRRSQSLEEALLRLQRLRPPLLVQSSPTQPASWTGQRGGRDTVHPTGLSSHTAV